MFPTWLNPTQVQILTISEKHISYAKKIQNALVEVGVRTEMDTGDDTIGKKLRTHRAMRPSYLLILGDEEENNDTVSYLGPDRQQINGIPYSVFVQEIVEQIKNRT